MQHIISSVPADGREENPSKKTGQERRIAMIHYVLLKLAPGSDVDAAEARVRKTYGELAEARPYLNDPVVYRSCVQRDSNADIMAVIRLDSEEYLQPYLTHPLHVQMAQDLKDVVIGRTSFDHL